MPVDGDFELGFIVGLAVGEGSFSVAQGMPVFQLKMTVRHGPLLRWAHRRLPGSRVLGPYRSQGLGDERIYTLVMRGGPLRRVLVPLVAAVPLVDIDPHVFRRYARLRTLCEAMDPESVRETVPQPHIPRRFESPMTEKRREALARQFDLPGAASEQMGSLLGALEAEPDPPTTVRRAADAIDRHLADSFVGLRVPELAQAKRIADVGAGAGFPGLALAIALPDASVDLIEAQRRKCEVIERLAESAGVSNARAIPRRVEEWGAGEGRAAYDAVTVRAVASLAVLVEYAAPLLLEGGVLVAWKGKRDENEEHAAIAAAVAVGMQLDRVVRVYPFQDAVDRHLHVYRKIGPTPERFPRRPGMAAKRPLGT